MKFREFELENRKIRDNDYNKICEKIRIVDYNKSTDMCLIESQKYNGWLSTSVLIKDILGNRNSYLTNPSKIKYWKGF